MTGRGSAGALTAAQAMDERIRARRHAVAAASARRRRRAGASLALVVALVLAAAALATTPLFDIETVEVVGVEGAQAAEVRAVAAVVPGQNLLHLDRGAVADAVRRLPWVASVDVERVPPATVRITVTSRQPVAVLQLVDASWLVDAEGVVMAGGSQPDLPVIEAPDSVVPPPGSAVSDAAIRNALAVRDALPPALRESVDRYEATSERGLRLRLPAAGTLSPTPSEAEPPDDGEAVGGGEGAADAAAIWVRFGSAERADAKARAIELLLEQARIQARRLGVTDLGIAELDVRAPDNPVLLPRS